MRTTDPWVLDAAPVVQQPPRTGPDSRSNRADPPLLSHRLGSLRVRRHRQRLEESKGRHEMQTDRVTVVPSTRELGEAQVSARLLRARLDRGAAARSG